MQKVIQAMPDALIVVGASAIAYGAWLIHPAAGFITGGVLMIAAGVASALKASK
jgi:hypothetical protein